MEILSKEEVAHFEGRVARDSDKPRKVPTEHQDVSEWWMRGWDEVNHDKEREAQGEKT